MSAPICSYAIAPQDPPTLVRRVGGALPGLGGFSAVVVSEERFIGNNVGVCSVEPSYDF